jgi:hypothetical protein
MFIWYFTFYFILYKKKTSNISPGSGSAFTKKAESGSAQSVCGFETLLKIATGKVKEHFDEISASNC